MVFTDSEIEQFIRDGYVVVRGGFSSEIAAECRHFIWNQVPLWDHCTTYRQPMVQIQKVFNSPPFDRIMNERLKSAVDEVVGVDRWLPPPGYGWWSLLLPSFGDPPEQRLATLRTGGWHVDGGQFRIGGHLTDHHHALVTLFLFSDVGPGDGGTAMVRGSHLQVIRAVAEAGRDGIDWSDLKPRLPAELSNPIVDLVGHAGDVALMHPFLIHGFGANSGNRIRFACNPLFQLREAVQLARSDREYSPMELALRIGLGLE
jgi:hypothetical protein